MEVSPIPAPAPTQSQSPMATRARIWSFTHNQLYCAVILLAAVLALLLLLLVNNYSTGQMSKPKPPNRTVTAKGDKSGLAELVTFSTEELELADKVVQFVNHKNWNHPLTLSKVGSNCNSTFNRQVCEMCSHLMDEGELVHKICPSKCFKNAIFKSCYAAFMKIGQK